MFKGVVIVLLLSVIIIISRTNGKGYTRITSIPKKYVIIGLFPRGSKGCIWSEAFFYYINRINKVCDIFSLRLYELQNTQRNYVTTNLTLDIILDQSFTYENNSCNCAAQNWRLESLLGIVGGSTSGYTTKISEAVRYEKIPLVSYFATSDDLSDKNAYPNVLRTIPADSVQVDAIYSLLRTFNWTYVSLVYEDTNYGHSGFGAIRAKKICLAKSLPVTLSNIKETYKELANEKKANVIIIYASLRVVRAVLEKAYLENLENKIWILSEASGKSHSLLQLSKKFKAHIFLVIPTAGHDKVFEKYFLNLNPSEVKATPWFKYFFRKNEININNTNVTLEKFKSSFDFSYVGFLRNALMTYTEMVVKGLSHHFDVCNPHVNESLDMIDLISLLKNTSFKGLNDEEIRFDQNGNIRDYFFNIFAITKDKRCLDKSCEIMTVFTKFGSWISSNKSFMNTNEEIYRDMIQTESRCSDICSAGLTNINFESDKYCCWTCILCAKNQFKSKAGNFKCNSCPQNTLPNENRTACLTRSIVYISYNDRYGAIILALSCSCMIFTGFVLFIFTIKRNTPIIRSSNFTMSFIQLLSHLLVFSMTILYIGKNTSSRCKFRVYGISIFYILTVVLTLIKITHILNVFNRRYMVSKSQVQHQRRVNLLLIIGCLAIFSVVVIVLEKTNEKVIDEIAIITDTNYQIYHKCSSDSSYFASILYVLILQIFCGIQSFRGRNIPGEYNEANCISYAMFLSTVLLLLSLLLKNSIKSYENSTLLESCLIMGSNLSLMAVLYGYKIGIIIFHPHKNNATVFRDRCFRAASDKVNDMLQRNQSKREYTTSQVGDISTYDNIAFKLESDC